MFAVSFASDLRAAGDRDALEHAREHLRHRRAAGVHLSGSSALFPLVKAYDVDSRAGSCTTRRRRSLRRTCSSARWACTSALRHLPGRPHPAPRSPRICSTPRSCGSAPMSARVTLDAFRNHGTPLATPAFYTIVKFLVHRAWGDLDGQRHLCAGQVKWGDSFFRWPHITPGFPIPSH